MGLSLNSKVKVGSSCCRQDSKTGRYKINKLKKINGHWYDLTKFELYQVQIEKNQYDSKNDLSTNIPNKYNLTIYRILSGAC